MEEQEQLSSLSKEAEECYALFLWMCFLSLRIATVFGFENYRGEFKGGRGHGPLWSNQT